MGPMGRMSSMAMRRLAREALSIEAQIRGVYLEERRRRGEGRLELVRVVR